MTRTTRARYDRHPIRQCNSDLPTSDRWIQVQTDQPADQAESSGSPAPRVGVLVDVPQIEATDDDL